MKKIFASVGMMALGAAALHAAGAVDNSKTWSVSATLRGFYDDNYTTAPKGNEEDSAGVYIAPSVGLNLGSDQTTFGVKYTFGAYWYEDRQSSDAVEKDAWDFNHQFDAFLDHTFSERFSVNLMDSFVIAQEPELLDPTGATSNPYRVEGDNMRNYARAHLNAKLTEKWSSVFGYANTYYNYELDEPANEVAFNGVASLSAINDRMEQIFLINLRWQMLQETVGVLGYNFGMSDYLSDEFVGVYNTVDQKADVRNSRTHALYAGVDHNFSRALSLSVRLGAQDADFYNDPTSDTDITPYGDISLNYTYKAGSSFRIGMTHMRSHTDVIAIDSSLTENAITSDQESTVLYGLLTHALTPRLTGTLSGQWQNGKFEGGLYDSQKEQYISLTAGLNYRFTRHLTGDVGYSFSTLDSDIPDRDYDRNRVYIGVTAIY